MTIRTRWPLKLLRFACALLGMRLAWTLTRSTTGWQTHLDQWVRVAASLVGVETIPLSDQDPDAQADFWLKEVSRVQSVEHIPRIALGAAWMLDAPQFGFVSRHSRSKAGIDLPGIPASWRRQDHDFAKYSLAEDFELRCRAECLARIETATQLDGNNVEVWRARALLLFQSKIPSLVLEPRRADWRLVLSECAEHDPDNALYDYLAAFYLWSSSAQWNRAGEDYDLKINDNELFDQANVRFAAGLAKQRLCCGTDGSAATMAFLEQSSLAVFDRMAAAESPKIDSRVTDLMYQITRLQSMLRDLKQRTGNLDATIAAVRKVLRISEQVSEHGNSPDVTDSKWILRRWGLASLKELSQEYPEILDVAAARKISAEYAQTVLELRIWEEVVKQWNAKSDKENGTDSLLAVGLSVTAQMFVIVALCLAALSSLLALVCGSANPGEPVSLGWLSQVAAWVLGIGISFVMCGMCPAEIVSPSVQTGFLRGLIWVGFLLFVGGLLIWVRRQFQLTWTQLVVLTAVAASPVAIVFHGSAIVDAGIWFIASSPTAISTVSLLLFVWTGWKSLQSILAFARCDLLTQRRKLLVCSWLLLLALIAISAGTALESVLSEVFQAETWQLRIARNASEHRYYPFRLPREGANWLWAFIQWQDRHGAIVGSLIAVSILLSCHLVRRASQVAEGYRQIVRSLKRSEMGQAGIVIARSSLVASLIFLLVYLEITPTVAARLEAAHRFSCKRLVDPAWVWDEINAATAQIKSDESLLARLKAEIAERNERIRKQK